MSKEVCGIQKSLIAKWNTFLRNQVGDQFGFICLGNWELKLQLAIEIQEIDMHKIQQTAQVLFREVKVCQRISRQSYIPCIKRS